MKSLRRSYWYISLYFKKHAKTFLGAMFAGILIFAVVLPLLTKLPQVKPTKYVGVIGGYTFTNLPITIQQQISRGLTQADADGTVIPDIAERWSIEDDGKTYRFVLKNSVRWQDGKLLEPSDIAFNFQDTQIITTENEIVFKLKEPFAPFPIVVSQPLFREVKTPYLRFFQKKRIVGTGKYSITRIKMKENVIDQLVLDSPSERIVYRFYLTEERAKTAFMRGNIDIINEVSKVHELSEWSNVEISPEIHFDQYLGIFFNHNDPLFQKNIRQALAYSIQKPDGDARARGPINPNSWAYLEGVKSYSFDQQRAVERILDEVTQQPLHFTLTTTAGFQLEAEELKRQWEELGLLAESACQSNSDIKDKSVCPNTRIQVQIVVTAYPDVNDYQVMLVGQQIPKDPDQYSLWHSTQNTNFTKYKNPRIDALLENGRKITDQTERKAIYQEFQQFLLEDSPAIFLQHIMTYTVTRK